MWIATSTDFQTNDESLREELEFVEETRSEPELKEAAIKQKTTARHNTKVVKQEFKVGDFVPQQKQEDSKEGKFATNWDWSYRVCLKMGTGAYDLEDLI